MNIWEVLLIIYLVIGGTFLYITFNLNVDASQKALEICQKKGFDNYKSYQIKLFSSTPYGVNCEYAPRSIQVTNQK